MLMERLRKILRRIGGAGHALVLLAVLSSVGCTGLANLRPIPEGPEIPDSWQESGGTDAPAVGPSAEDLAAWWRLLGDPVLDQLVERTIAGNLDLETAAARVQEARARRGLAKSERGPSVTAQLSSTRTEALGDQVVQEDSVSASLATTWEADLFGAKRLSLAASQADLEAEIENLRAARVALVAETVVAYADLRVAEARLRVLDETLASREETYRLTDWREQAGLASRLEVNQALSALGQARAERPAAERSATEARLRLSLLAGDVPGSFDDLLAPTGSEYAMPAPPETVDVGIPAETLRQRPDVRAAERQLEAALARLGVAEAARYPTVALTGSLDARAADVSDLFDLDSMVSNLVSGLTAPIFESGRIRGNIAVRGAQWEQAALAYESTVLGALSEVERALVAFRSSQERLAALEEAVESAAEAAALAEQRYTAGLVDLLSVLDTERTLFSLEEQLVLAEGERLSSFSNLYRALGGGWDAAARPFAAGGSDV